MVIVWAATDFEVIVERHRGRADVGALLEVDLAPAPGRRRSASRRSLDAGVTRATQMGSRSWLMKSVHVGHDVVIGEDCEIAPMSAIAGHCTIGDRVRMGVGVIIRPYITVGDGARLGAGAVVISDVPAGEVWVGNPARPLPPKAS